MTIGAKLQLRAGQQVAVVGLPDGVDLDLPDGVSTGTAPDVADAVVLFARTKVDLDEQLECVLAAARDDRLTWIAYPKAGQLGTDLNRDVLAGYLTSLGVHPVRQIAVDDVWSALRFRPD